MAFSLTLFSTISDKAPWLFRWIAKIIYSVKNISVYIDYLKYQHDEFHLVPVLDESGNMLLREEFYLDGLNCHPETFDLECELLNQQYHKNNTYDEIKSHHYIISHDPRDNADHDLTGEHAQAIGLEYAKANFPGHQALVCTHTDGNNGTGNIKSMNCSFVITSLRQIIDLSACCRV